MEVLFAVFFIAGALVVFAGVMMLHAPGARREQRASLAAEAYKSRTVTGEFAGFYAGDRRNSLAVRVELFNSNNKRPQSRVTVCQY